jgi:hypothetical protein
MGKSGFSGVRELLRCNHLNPLNPLTPLTPLPAQNPGKNQRSHDCGV